MKTDVNKFCAICNDSYDKELTECPACEAFPALAKLKKRFKENDLFSLKEAWQLIYFENGVCTAVCDQFCYWATLNGITLDQKFKWPIWNSMFENFSIGDYRKISQDTSQSIDYIQKGRELLCQ